MVGLQSLAPGQAPMPGQGQMAGQPAMPGMLPKPQGIQPGVPALVPSLVGMDMGRLLQMFADPNNPVPKNRILAAMTEKQKEMAARQAVQGQMAMAQAQQQPGTVKDQVVQKAMQGAAQGYAGGGAVAFTKGGASEDLRDDESLPLMERIRRARLRQASGGTSLVERPLLDTLVSRLRGETPPPVAQTAASTRTTDTSKLFPFGVPESPMMEVPEIQVAAPAPGPSAAPGGQRRQPSAAPAPATQPALAPQAALSPEMEAYFRNRASDLRTRQGLPEDIVSGRAGLESLARENIAAQRGEAETFGREARERRDAALARSQRGLLDDPQALLALAGGIDTRRGQGIGSLARGAAGLMSQREAAAEAARKEYATAQQTERALQANVRQATMLEAQRAQALREGDFNRANQIKDQIDALMMQRETLLMERRDKAIEQQRQERLAQATERQAKAAEVSAGKPSGEIALMQWLQDPKNRKMYEELQSSKRAEDRNLKLYEIYTKNKLMLGNMSFEDFAAGLKDATGGGAASGGKLKYNPATGKIE